MRRRTARRCRRRCTTHRAWKATSGNCNRRAATWSCASAWTKLWRRRNRTTASAASSWRRFRWHKARPCATSGQQPDVRLSTEMPKATHLECSLCAARYDAAAVGNLCTCGGPLLVRYDLAVIRHRWPRREVASGPANMWRYAPVLPPAEASVVTLGEGWTPLVRTRRLGTRIGAEQLWVKDEGLNPTASFKARGLACAVSMCVELGIRKVAIPSAGNAASAMAAY